MRTVVFMSENPDLEQSTGWLRTSNALTTRMLINLNYLVWRPLVLDPFSVHIVSMT